MLNDRERSVLSQIEHGLVENDPKFAAAIGAGRCPPHRRPRGGHWRPRLLFACGLVVFLTGAVTATPGLVVQGLVAVAAAVCWDRWLVVSATRASRRDGGQRDGRSVNPSSHDPGPA